jgi:hypothetical protein
MEYDMSWGTGQPTGPRSVVYNAHGLFWPMNRWCHVREEYVRLPDDSKGQGPWRCRIWLKGGYPEYGDPEIRAGSSDPGPFDTEMIQTSEHTAYTDHHRPGTSVEFWQSEAKGVRANSSDWQPEQAWEFRSKGTKGMRLLDNVAVRELVPCGETAR